MLRSAVVSAAACVRAAAHVGVPGAGWAAVPSALGSSVSSTRARFLRTSVPLGTKRDFYEVLGVKKEASPSEIKAAYFKLAKKYHPDVNPGNKEASKNFAELSEAYEILSDSEKRAQYDQYGHTQPGGFGSQDFEGFRGQMDPEDLFSSLFGKMGFNMQGAGAQIEVSLSFDEAVDGATRRVSFPTRATCGTCSGSGSSKESKPVKCPTCKGSGQEAFNLGFQQLISACRKCSGRGTIIKDPCTTCHGRGKVEKTVTKEIRIPAGIDDGMNLRVSLEDRSVAHVLVRVAPSPIFTRDGADVHSNASISLAQAMLGGSTLINGLYGDINIKVPAGTAHGKRQRLPSRGLEQLGGGGRGDHYITFNVHIPTHLTEKQKRLMLEWAAEEKDRNGVVTGLEDYLSRRSGSHGKNEGGDESGTHGATSTSTGHHSQGPHGTGHDGKHGGPDSKHGGADSKHDGKDGKHDGNKGTKTDDSLLGRLKKKLCGDGAEGPDAKQ
eukprot:m.21958 g.21958  ORF g.21958 m.21958 type:complete len:495 (+) comp3688_c0_seq2:29-1513(+)